jgi:excisionase family DNA binding protein
MLTPPEIAKHLRVSSDKDLAWIRSGELRAVNVATRLGGRPRYKVQVSELEAFEARRAAVTEKRPIRRRARRDERIIEYF